MIYAFYAGLVLVAFLIMLNGFLRGTLTQHVDGLLSLLLIGLLIATFWAGWKFGILGIGIFFVSGVITRPIAARLVFEFRKRPEAVDSSFVGLPPRSLLHISEQLAKPFDSKRRMKEAMNELVEGGSRKADPKDALLDYCEKQPAIQELLKQTDVSRDGLKALYSMLVIGGAGQWAGGHFVAASAFAYSEALRYVIKRQGKDMQETAYSLIMYFERGSALKN